VWEQRGDLGLAVGRATADGEAGETGSGGVKTLATRVCVGSGERGGDGMGWKREINF
jgi:hypothetical protein